MEATVEVHHSVYDIITEQIVQQLESGVAPSEPKLVAKLIAELTCFCSRFADGVRPIG
jgi:hypothetical protein